VTGGGFTALHDLRPFISCGGRRAQARRAWHPGTWRASHDGRGAVCSALPSSPRLALTRRCRPPLTATLPSRRCPGYRLPGIADPLPEATLMLSVSTCSQIEVVPHSCKFPFCPTCGRHGTDRWAGAILNDSRQSR
jgi:hypothetical protein